MGLGDQLRDVFGLPVDVLVTHGLRVIEAFQRTGLAPDHARQVRPHHAGSAFAHRMANTTLVGEQLGATALKRRAIGSQRGLRQGEGQQTDEGQSQEVNIRNDLENPRARQ